jgi:prepilin-type N-terminal cleavage/methylation domain-containing protein/prepilin-type processing-associated H-X9-DG protein
VTLKCSQKESRGDELVRFRWSVGLAIQRPLIRLPRRTLPTVDRGFSLLELLIVVAIIFVLFTLYFGGGTKGYQTKQIANCEKNLQNVYVALKTFSMDNHDQLPAAAGAATSEIPLSQLIPRSTTGAGFFICPGSKDSQLPDAQPFANRKISYAYYMGRTLNDGADQPLLSDRQVNTNPKRAGEQLFSGNGKKPGNNHRQYGGNVVFCDGNVQSSPAHSAFALTNTPKVVLLNPKP